MHLNADTINIVSKVLTFAALISVCDQQAADAGEASNVVDTAPAIRYLMIGLIFVPHCLSDEDRMRHGLY